MPAAKAIRRVRQLADVVRYGVVSSFDRGFHPLGAAQAMAAALQMRYSPDEAYYLGLLKPGADARREERLLSKSRMVVLQRRANPVSWQFVMSDKGVFARWVQVLGLPAPRLLAWTFPGGMGMTASGAALGGADAVRRFLLTEAPSEFVIKETRSAYGSSVRVYRREGEQFFRFGDVPVSLDHLVTDLLSGDRSGRIMQERVHNHPELMKLTAAAGLQTARFVTVVGCDGEVSVVTAVFKAIAGGNEVDNFRHGSIGNLLARINPSDGTLDEAVTLAGGGGVVTVQHHPDTGMAFRGFRLPDWEKAFALARRCARAFAPVRLVGFDIAFSERGPLLIEGNFWGDPPVMTWQPDDPVRVLTTALGGAGPVPM
jgi:hypothetical protein